MTQQIERHTADRPCPVCGGSENDPRGEDRRCWGFVSGEWVHCTREEYSSGCSYHEGSRTYSHKRRGPCACGVEHAPEPPKASRSGRRSVVRIYPYLNRAGQVVHETLRWQGEDGTKSFSQRRPDGAGGYVTRNVFEGITPVLYNLPELAAADPSTVVWIVEGEKDVETLKAHGLLATSNVMGAGKWRAHYADDLSRRVCRIIPDNDGKGRSHADQVAKSLYGCAVSIKIVELPGLPEKGDVTDFLAAGHAVAELLELAGKAPEWEPGLEKEKPKARGKSSNGNGNGNGNGQAKIESGTDVLLGLTESVSVFRTPAGDPWVSLPINGHHENYPATSLAVNRWLNFRYWNEKRTPCPGEAIQRVQDILIARACFEGEKDVETCVRIARANGPSGLEFYLDLGNDKGTAVHVTADGWKFVTDPPARFRRPGGMGPLPEPASGGDLDLLWDLLNLEGEDPKRIVIAALTWALIPGGPYPVIVVTGEQGSAKSTSCRLLKHCIDPCRPKLGAQPESLRDFMVIAESGWMFTVDNVSKLPPWFSDALARLATGAGFQVRKHYSNDEAQIFEATRPMVLNGIEDFAHRADLLNRALLVTCPLIPDDKRKEEKVIWAEFDDRHARIVGAILDVAAGAMRLHPTVQLPGLIRMADFERWGEAVCRHLGDQAGNFSRIVRANRDEATGLVLEDSPVAVELLRLKVPGGHWQGSCLELLEKLQENATPTSRNASSFPKTPRGISGQLRRLAPALRRSGVEIEFAGHHRTEDSPSARLLSITWRSAENSSNKWC